MHALVTGGHGFVGSHLVERLLDEGHAVRCLVRRPGRPPALAGLDADIVRGDVRDRERVCAALHGVDHVFHLAALTRSLTRREMLETNTGGTRVLVEAAREAGLPGRFVFCSSLAAVGPAKDGRPLDEQAPRRPLTWYGESKARAEDAVRAAAPDLPSTIVRPPAVYGPGDLDFLRLFRSVGSGLVPIAGRPDARYSLIHGRDLAGALIAAATAEATCGGTYFAAAAQIVTQIEMIEAAEAALGKRAWRVRLPSSMLQLIGQVTDLCSQLSGRPSLLGEQRMRELRTAHWVCSPGALERDSGWRAEIDLPAGFRETVTWYREAGRL